MTTGRYPHTRFRRLRKSDALRRLSREATLTVDDLIWPVFVTDVPGADAPIPSMPGVSRLTVEGAVAAAENLLSRLDRDLKGEEA